MIPPIVWPQAPGDNASPFSQANKPRPLRVTIHSASLARADGSAKEAVDTIYELATLEDIELVDFEGNGVPRIEVHRDDPAADHVPLKMLTPEGEVVSWHAGVHRSRLSPGRVQAIFGINDTASHDFREAERDLFCLEAHWALGRDVLVTLSPHLLAIRETLDYANARTPGEAAPIIGLLLRSRGNWVFRKTAKVTYTTDRGMFYWVLMRSKLPKHWRFFSALVNAQNTHGEGPVRLGQSILERCCRALQARDEIARQFYLPQDNNTRDLMMYHFDYLTLLLAGAFDAQAAIVNLVYGLQLNDWDVGFRKRAFVDALTANGLIRLASEVTGGRCAQLMVMLHKLRNTIHSAGLPTYAYSDASRPQASHASAPDSFRDELEQTALALGGLDHWGLRRDEYLLHDSTTGVNTPSYDISIQPYAYASRLVDQWFPLLDDIAEAIETERLLEPAKRSHLSSTAPDDWADMIDRFSILGP